ncbi:MAG: hypothetical protein NTW08_00015 [Gammaproteobacteria bacterium]|nr:hypothetical protein [Gammaproteobacteria bacterium]
MSNTSLTDKERFLRMTAELESSIDDSISTQIEPQVEAVAQAGVGIIHKIIAPTISFILHGLELFTLPRRCYQEKRWPITDEWFMIALCVMGIIFTAVALTFPFLAVFLMIGAASVSFLKTLLETRMLEDELHRMRQLVSHGRTEIKQLLSDTERLENIAARTTEEQNELQTKLSTLTELTDQYLKEGGELRRLKRKYYLPIKVVPDTILKATAALSLIAAITAVFSPLFGFALMIAAGVICLVTTLISIAVQKIAKKNQAKKQAAESVDSSKIAPSAIPEQMLKKHPPEPMPTPPTPSLHDLPSSFDHHDDKKESSEEGSDEKKSDDDSRSIH